MSKVGVVLVACLVGSCLLAQTDEPKPALSKDPLSAEQVAVYRAVLQDYMRGNERAALNLANKTDPIDLSDASPDEPCFKGIHFAKGGKAQPVVHSVDSSVTLSTQMVLVDPDRHSTVVKDNDPGKLIQKSAENGQNLTDDQLNKSVDQAFATGLFTLSEIAFDQKHTFAVVQFSFWCGRLCGHGATVVLKKSNSSWKIKRRCVQWIS